MDRDPQTAAELYELVSQWPKEARPEGIDPTKEGCWDLLCDRYFLTDHARLMFIASGLRWLIENTTSFHTMRTVMDDISIEHFGLDDNAEWIRSRAPTLLLALHAAILAAKENA